MFYRFLISITTFLICLAGLEVYLQFHFPFSQVLWPSHFSPTAGYTFQPNSEVKFTNFINFATSGRANSRGFLDEEPPSEIKLPDEYRIVFLGDSYVEAAQVPNEFKFHRLILRQLSEQFPTKRVTGAAFGYSGAGTSSEVPFYTEFGRPLQPNLVVLVFAYNDLANNSALLESVRHGWAPTKVPRRLYDMKDGKPTVLPISLDFDKHMLPVQRISTTPTWKSYGNEVIGGSKLYRWASSRLTWATEKEGAVQTYAQRIAYLQQLPEYAEKLAGWKYPNDLDFDYMFYSELMPEAFHDAVQMTKMAFADLHSEVQRDNAELLVLVDESCYRDGALLHSLSKHRAITPKLMGARIEAMLKELHIPFINFRSALDARGVKNVIFSHDIHWTALGHSEAAMALLPSISARIKEKN